MVVGSLKIELCLPENRSLKGKRKVVKSMVGKVKSRFNVSIAEVGSNDKWQRIELGSPRSEMTGGILTRP
jgi:hypothetical protein